MTEAGYYDQSYPASVWQTTPPVPPEATTVSSIAPDTLGVADADTDITVTGTGFTAESEVWVDERLQDTVFVSETELMFTVATGALGVGEHGVYVMEDGEDSNQVSLTVTLARDDADEGGGDAE